MEIFEFWNKRHLYGKKVILILAVLLFTSEFVNAQQNLLKHENKKVYFGILAGFNSTRFQVEHSEDFILNDSIKLVESPNTPGFNLGIVSNLKFNNQWSLRFIPTLVFAEKDLRYTEIKQSGDSTFVNTVESIYFNFPLGIKYRSDRFYDNFRFYIMSGMRMDLDLTSNSKKRRNDLIKLGRIDMAAEIGFGFEIYFPMFIFSPEIKIARGINNVHIPTENYRYSEVIGALRSRTITVSLQIEG